LVLKSTIMIIIMDIMMIKVMAMDTMIITIMIMAMVNMIIFLILFKMKGETALLDSSMLEKSLKLKPEVRSG